MTHIVSGASEPRGTRIRGGRFSETLDFLKDRPKRGDDRSLFTIKNVLPRVILGGSLITLDDRVAAGPKESLVWR